MSDILKQADRQAKQAYFALLELMTRAISVIDYHELDNEAYRFNKVREYIIERKNR